MRFDIPADWPSGVYVAMLIEIAADGSEIAPDTTTSFGTAAKALFVLRHRGAVAPGTVLYKVSWATFVAYNGTGYGSLYTEAVWSRTQPNPGFKVTWRRPGCGTGGDVMPAIRTISTTRRRGGRPSSTGMRRWCAGSKARASVRTIAPTGTCIRIPALLRSVQPGAERRP